MVARTAGRIGSTAVGSALVCRRGTWLRYGRPTAVGEARSLADVVPLLEQVARAADAGATAVGYLAYEAAPAFDPALACRPLPGTLAWFAVFDDPPQPCEGPLAGLGIPLDWQAEWGEEDYLRRFATVREFLGRGETYQVNLTMRLRARFVDDPLGLMGTMVDAQPAPYAAYLDTGDIAVCSASPELFFELDGVDLRSKPMKGTAPRGRTTAEDLEIATRLAGSPKERAENLMVVDMVRNDFGRVCTPGSVTVPTMFEVERYRTVHQMTSTVEGRTTASIIEIFAALFPCASVTGAPKVQTMRHIAELESSPRGMYCGCVGTIGPGRKASFNVAIRTAVVDRRCGVAEYGVGGGIVWDSEPLREYAECAQKALGLAPREPVKLLETLRWDPAKGYGLLDRHLARMRDSAGYFGMEFPEAAVLASLARVAAGKTVPHRVRVVLGERGAVATESSPLESLPCPLRVAFAKRPVDPASALLYHKTTAREVYDQAREETPGFDDIILWNPEGEVTESCLANVVCLLDGEKVTPASSCGLLAGTFRAGLLESGEILEAVVTLDDVRRAEALWLVNSVRGWMPAILDEAAP